ncbi:MAG: diacylglycerol kinase family protein [Myxococcota bacterium]
MKPLVILNPQAEGGRAGKHAADIRRVVESYLGPLEMAPTEGPRHAVTIAREAAEAHRDLVVVVGGDGTVHEVVNGIMAASVAPDARPTLGLVGQGTGGDFRKSLGLVHRLDQYCLAMARRRTRRVDIGRMTYRDRDGEATSGHFINILSAGMGGLVDEYVATSHKRFGGKAAYLSASVKALMNNEVGALKVTLDPDTDDVRELAVDTRLIAVCNGRFFGGGMEVAPMAEPDDGWFDVVSLGSAPKLQFALSTLSIYRGRHVDNPDVLVQRARQIRVELGDASTRFPLDVDGEPLGSLPLDIEVVPGALSFCVP